MRVISDKTTVTYEIQEFTLDGWVTVLSDEDREEATRLYYLYREADAMATFRLLKKIARVELELLLGVE